MWAIMKDISESDVLLYPKMTMGVFVGVVLFFASWHFLWRAESILFRLKKEAHSLAINTFDHLWQISNIRDRIDESWVILHWHGIQHDRIKRSCKSSQLFFGLFQTQDIAWHNAKCGTALPLEEVLNP